jgi:hypothetical protein
MFIFRFEHNRKECKDPFFNENGASLTGHGTMKYQSYCPIPQKDKPRFGGSGSPPYRIMAHERCAVTAEQFKRWRGVDMWGFDRTSHDDELFVKGWDLVAYWVEGSSEYTDWRYDNDQVIFNPEFAVNMGMVTMTDVLAIEAEENVYF